MLKSFVSSESGATAIEYGLIAMFIAIVIVAMLGAIGGNLNTVFVQVNAGFSH